VIVAAMIGRLALLLALIPAIALAADAPQSLEGDPVRPPPHRAPKAAAAAPKPAAPVSMLAAPVAAPAVDPAECRAACAQTRYFCLAGDQGDDCGGRWSQCVVGCNSPDLSPTISLAP
jgi:hypothetical protein